MVSSAIWAAVVIYALVRGEIAYRDWLRHQSPLNEKQYKELTEELSSLKNQVTKLSINQGFLE